MHLILSLFNPFLIVPLLSLLTYVFYDFASVNIIYISFPLLLFFVLTFKIVNVFYYNLSVRVKFNADCLTLRGGLWSYLSIVIVIVSLIQFFVFGIPLLGDIVYADFGLPFLHHIAVSTWLFVFIKHKSKFVNFLLLAFMFLNPIFIVNRDLLFLSLFLFSSRYLLINGISTVKALLFLLAGVFLFVFIGELRSGYAFDIIELPINFDYKNFGPSFFWLFIYLTSSTFNAAFNLDSGSLLLYSNYINVFPEYYAFYRYLGLLGFYLYFILAVFLIIISSFFGLYRYIIIMFLQFQFVMGSVFADKFFITHSLFVLLLFFLVFLFKRKEIKPYYNKISNAS